MENLKKLRISHNLTQKEIADELGMNQQTYANYEAGRREPGFDILREMSSYFNVSIDYLLDIENESYVNENHENFMINFQTAIQLQKKNYFEFATEWYKYVKSNHLQILELETPEQIYTKIYSWIVGESLPTILEQKTITDILSYPINMVSGQFLLNEEIVLFVDFDELKRAAECFYLKNHNEKKLTSDDYYEYYILLEHDLSIQSNILKNKPNKKLSNSFLEKIKECLNLVRNAMESENKERTLDFYIGTKLLKNKMMEINDESLSKSISKRKHLLMFFKDINLNVINDVDIKQYRTDFLEQLYQIIINQIKNNQFLYYIVHEHNLINPVNEISEGYDYCLETFKSIEQAKKYIKDFGYKYTKKTANINDPLEKANAIKKLIIKDRKKSYDEILNVYYENYPK